MNSCGLETAVLPLYWFRSYFSSGPIKAQVHPIVMSRCPCVLRVCCYDCVLLGVGACALLGVGACVLLGVGACVLSGVGACVLLEVCESILLRYVLLTVDACVLLRVCVVGSWCLCVVGSL
jgi:hypothetical protein